MPSPLDALELERIYADYLLSCDTHDIQPIPRERALGLLQQWTEVLSKEPELTAH